MKTFIASSLSLSDINAVFNISTAGYRLILIAGFTIIAALLLKSGLNRIRVPGLVGFMALGLFIRIADSRLDFISRETETVFTFLSQVGIIALLFRIGLESNLRGLLQQLPHATLIWAGNIVVSGLAGYTTARLVLDMPLIPSLFTGVSMTATSIGVSMAVWREKKLLKSPDGELLMDVAELDDISGVGLMAALLAAASSMHSSGSPNPELSGILSMMAWFVIKLGIFAAICLAFSRYLERPLTGIFRKSGHRETTMLLVTGVGFIIAAIAGWLGFSLAIGALFAGLSFSRDPDSVKVDTSFESIYELFTPFFFIGIGLNMNPGALIDGILPGAILLIVAVVSKIAGTSLPARMQAGTSGALLIGVSMVPRAEITMIIMQRGRELGEWAVSARLFSAMAFVSAATCLAVPFILSRYLDKS